MVVIVAGMVAQQWWLRGPYFRRRQGPLGLPGQVGPFVAPVDGTVVYCRAVELGPLYAQKADREHYAGIVRVPSWHVGLFMTPFDRHCVLAPCAGQVVAVDHWKVGRNLPMLDLLEYVRVMFMRRFDRWLERHLCGWITQNERVVLTMRAMDGWLYQLVLIGDKYVNKIDLFVKVGDYVDQHRPLGFIRRGSQVDIVVPRGELMPTDRVVVGQGCRCGDPRLFEKEDRR
jgi:phosphatidylserine decarboxylase